MNYTWWTADMEKYLVENYCNHGDKELAEMFELKFPKPFKWTKKHIEKKRYYMKLKRSPEQIHAIRCQNNKDGRQFKMWQKRNKGQHGEVRNWGGRRYINISGEWILERRYIAGALPGEVVRTYEGGMVVIDRKINQKMNAEMRLNMHPELKQTIKALNQLKKIIHGKENSRP